MTLGVRFGTHYSFSDDHNHFWFLVASHPTPFRASAVGKWCNSLYCSARVDPCMSSDVMTQISLINPSLAILFGFGKCIASAAGAQAAPTELYTSFAVDPQSRHNFTGRNLDQPENWIMAAETSLGSMSAVSDRHLQITENLPIYMNTRRRRDEYLVDRIRCGQKELFYELVRPHLTTVQGIVYRNLRDPAKTEDVVQQSIIQAFVHFHQLRSPEFFRGWLIRIAINEARMARRPDRNVCSMSIGWYTEGEDGETVQLDEIPDERTNPFLVLERKETQEIFRTAIRCLPCKLRDALLLRDMEEYSIRETASKLGISIPATKARLHKARLRLKAFRSIIALQQSMPI